MMAGEPFTVGKTAASAGRVTPGTTPCTILAVAITAPVFPADTRPWARPARTNRDAILTELSFLVRTAVVASSMVMTSSAFSTSMGSSRVFVVLFELLPDQFLAAHQDDLHA